MKELFFFNKMITPNFVTVLYWLSLAAIVFAALSAWILVGFYAALSALFFGAIWVRVIFERIIIAFKNNEYLKIIAEKNNGQAQ